MDIMKELKDFQKKEKNRKKNTAENRQKRYERKLKSQARAVERACGKTRKTSRREIVLSSDGSTGKWTRMLKWLRGQQAEGYDEIVVPRYGQVSIDLFITKKEMGQEIFYDLLIQEAHNVIELVNREARIHQFKKQDEI